MKTWRKHLIPACLVLVIAACLAMCPASAAPAGPADGTEGQGTSVTGAVDYIKGSQRSDGGFGEPGKDSSPSLTAWVVCGLSAAGRDASAWRKGGSSPLDYLEARVSKLSKLTDLEKMCLAVCCAGKNPRSFGGRDLVSDIKARMAGDGHIGDLVNEHCWGVIALKAAGEALPDGSRSWLVARQNLDGGYGYGVDTGSDPDDTGAALQALAAAGEGRDGNAVKRALSYLHLCQTPDAGFGYNSDSSNAGSTAWAIQGIIAAGQDPASGDWTRGGRTPVDCLVGMQQGDGHFRYMASSDANPVWMTAEALPAVSGKAYPLSKDAEPGATDPSSGNTRSAASALQSGEKGTSASEGGPGGGDSSPGGEGSIDGRRRGSSSGEPGEADAGLAMNGGGPGARGQGRSGGFAAFLVICATYLVLLALVRFSLPLIYRPGGR